MGEPIPEFRRRRDVDFVDAERGWATGVQGVVLRTRDGGATWGPQNIELTTSLTGVDFLDRLNGWISHRDGVLVTLDGGATWMRRAAGTDDYIYDLHVLNAHVGWAVSADAILVTRDTGATWMPRLEAVVQPRAVHFLDDLHGWVVGVDGLILRTVDGGDTWVNNTAAPPPASALRFVGGGGGFGLDDVTNTRSGQGFSSIRKTADGGRSWRSLPGPAGEVMVDAAFIDERRG